MFGEAGQIGMIQRNIIDQPRLAETGGHDEGRMTVEARDGDVLDIEALQELARRGHRVCPTPVRLEAGAKRARNRERARLLARRQTRVPR